MNLRTSFLVSMPILLASVVASPAQVKIGVGAPLTGPNASYGDQFKLGAEQAAADINAAGGINGQKVVLVYGDDVSDPRQGVSAANKFVGEGVKVVVGHFNSGVCIPASEVYHEGGVIMITPGCTNPKITDRGFWNTFRVVSRDDQQGEVAGTYIANKFKDKRIAVVHDKTPYGQGVADETKKSMNRQGVKEVLYEGINPGEKDYTALVTKIKTANVDLVYYGGLHTEAGLIVRQMRDQGAKARMMSADGITSDEFPAIGGDGVIGTLMSFPPDPRTRPASAEVLKRYKDKGITPGAYALYTYAAIQVYQQAAAKAGSLESKRVAYAILSGGKFETVIGELTYDKKGDRTRPDFSIYVWDKDPSGKITYLECPAEGCAQR